MKKVKTTDIQLYSLLRYANKEKTQVEGAFSPMMSSKEICKSFELKIHGLARLNNPYSQSGYDHLIIKTNYKNGGQYYLLFCDMGTELLPICGYATNTKDFILGELYLTHITKKAQKQHRDNCEIQDRSDLPVFTFLIDEAVFTKEFKENFKNEYLSLIEHAENIKAFKIKEYE